MIEAIAVPLLTILKRISKEYQELKALVVASLEEAAIAAESGRPISAASVKARLTEIVGEAADVVQAIKAKS